MEQLQSKKPRRQAIGIVIDDQVLEAYEQAERARIDTERGLTASRERRLRELAAAGFPPIEALSRVDTDDERALTPLRDAEQAALAVLDERTLRFEFTALGSKRFEALVDAHPPTEYDHERAAERGERAVYSRETFIPELLQACSTGFPLTDEDIESLFGTPTVHRPAEEDDPRPDQQRDADPGEAWSEAEVAAIVATCLAVNTAVRTR